MGERFVLSLRIVHPSSSSVEIQRRLGRVARSTWSLGDFIPSKGHIPAKRKENSFCSFPLTVNSEESLDAAIARHSLELWELVDPIRKLMLEGAKIELFVGWFLDSQTGVAMDAGTLTRLSSMQITLSFAVYPPLQ